MEKNNVYLKNIQASAFNLIKVIQGKQWERLESKTWDLENALKLLEKNKVDEDNCICAVSGLTGKLRTSNITRNGKVTGLLFIHESLPIGKPITVQIITDRYVMNNVENDELCDATDDAKRTEP